jgi:hypothetical protein
MAYLEVHPKTGHHFSFVIYQGVLQMRRAPVLVLSRRHKIAQPRPRGDPQTKQEDFENGDLHDNKCWILFALMSICILEISSMMMWVCLNMGIGQ